MRKPFAVFDVDGTLHEGAMGVDFIVELSRQGYTKHPIHDLYEAWQFSPDRATFFMTHFYPEFSTITPITRAEMERIGTTIAQRVSTNIRPRLLSEIEVRRSEGNTLLIVSNSPSVTIAPLAQLLGFDGYYAPETQFDIDGIYAGPRVRTPAEKDKSYQLQQLVHTHQLTKKGSYAYGDTVEDIPMLTYVAYPVAVTPTAELRTFALEHNWAIIDL